MLQTFLLTMAEINVTISALILLLLLFTRLFGSRYTARCRYILWIVVILRLCIPMGTPFIPALLEIPLPPETEQTETLSDVQNVPEPPENARVSAADQPSPTINGSTEQEFFPPEGQSTAEPAQTPSVQEKDNGLRDMLLPILTGLWAAVAFLLFAARFGGYLLVSGRLRRTLLHPSEMQTDLCKRLGIRQGLKEKSVPQLYITREVHSPMLCGFRKPIILLPDIPLTDNQLTGVLAHELTHRRRNDLWVKLACTVATSLHWFNPLVHIAAGRCNREMELSCDELVLAGMDEAVRMAYGKVMLDIIKRCNTHVSGLTTHFNPRRSAVRERFDGILDGTIKKKGLWLIGMMLVLCIAAGSLVAFGKAEPAMTDVQAKEIIQETTETAADRKDAGQEVYPVTLTVGETYNSFGRTTGWFTPAFYGEMDMTVLQNGELPFPANSTDPQETLYYYNQISYLSEYTRVFAVTGALYAYGNPAYAYVFSRGDDGLWNVTVLGTEDAGSDCKGVVLLGVPGENSLGWLLGMLHDNGSIRFFESDDGQTWRCSGTFLHPENQNAWLVQFSKHSGIGGETLCLVFASPTMETEQIWLSFDWGQSFTRYEIPVLETLPGGYEDVIYLYKSSGGGSTEFSLYFQVNGPRNSRYACYQSAHGDTEGVLSFHERNIAEDAQAQYRYRSAGDWGNVSYHS